jgi:hypothetical protein
MRSPKEGEDVEVRVQVNRNIPKRVVVVVVVVVQSGGIEGRHRLRDGGRYRMDSRIACSAGLRCRRR